MQRTLYTFLAAGVLAASLVGCSANGQSGCTQPPVQQYPAPQLVDPQPGQANVPSNTKVIQISTQTLQIVGTLVLKSASGAIIGTGAAAPAKVQPNPNSTLWNVNLTGALQPHTAYNLVWTLQYPGGCLGPAIVHTKSLAGFTTGS